MIDREIEKVTIVELPIAELDQLSGMVDDSGREMTVLEALRTVEKDLAGGEVYASPNGVLSQEANDHNSRLLRQERATKYMVAVRSRRPMR